MMDIMDRAARIEAALAKRNFSSELAPRFERLLDGIEDRTRLRCCNSGCYVCVKQIHAVLDEVEAGLPAAAATLPPLAVPATATAAATTGAPAATAASASAPLAHGAP